jgi:hypothetical protein
MLQKVKRRAAFAGAHSDALRHQGDEIALQLLELGKPSADVDEFALGQLPCLLAGMAASYLQQPGDFLQAEARDEALTVSVGPVGTLRLTTSAAFGYQCLVPLLSEFRTRYPALKLGKRPVTTPSPQ